MSEVVVPLLDLPALAKTPSDQTRMMWTAIKNEDNFSSYQLAGINLASVEPKALANAATTASKISLCNSSLTADHVNALTIALDENVQEVNLSDNFLTDVHPELLARAVAKSRKLNLAYTEKP